MAESDDEYIQDISDDELDAHQVTRGAAAPGTKASRQGLRRGQQGWEVTRTWEHVVEGADGTINSTVEGLLQAGKRKRRLEDTTPIQRGIFRHLILLIDLSSAMTEKDYRPTRYLLTLRYAQEFVTEFFEQNPISQLGVIGMRDGLAVRVSDMSGNPSDHIGRLQALLKEEPKGHPSLQNGLEMARGALFDVPNHGTREVLILFGSLLTSDPGDIFTTITALCTSHITCTIIGLAAQVAICRTIVARTNPHLSPSESYTVPLSEPHYRDLLMRATTPPAMHNGPTSQPIKPTLIMMGFPSRILEPAPSLCACHRLPTRGGYLCTRCGTKVCDLGKDCPVCKLKLVSSTELARSYHHLFPLQNWTEVPWQRATAVDQKNCFACTTEFPLDKGTRRDSMAMSVRNVRVGAGNGVSESGRYECGNCGRHFCIDCDVFAHEVLHNCAGCLSSEGMLAAREAERGENGVEENGGYEEAMDLG